MTAGSRAEETQMKTLRKKIQQNAYSGSSGDRRHYPLLLHPRPRPHLHFHYHFRRLAGEQLDQAQERRSQRPARQKQAGQQEVGKSASFRRKTTTGFAEAEKE